MSKTLITDTLDRTVRTTGFKATLQRNADDAQVEKAEQARLDRIAKDLKTQEDWTRGRSESTRFIEDVKEIMVKEADAGLTHVNLTVAEGINRKKETAYDRGLLDGLVTWLKNESFKFEVTRSSIAADEAGPDSYIVGVKVSW